MSWKDQILASYRRAAGMDAPPPEDATYPRAPELVPFKRPDGHVSACYWSPQALAYKRAVIDHLLSKRALRPVDQLALARVIEAADEGFAPTKPQLDQYRLAHEYRDFLAEQWEAYGRELRPLAWRMHQKWKAWRDGGREGPEPPAWNRYEPGDEMPDVPGAPSPTLAFKRERMRNAGVSDDAVDKWIAVRKKAHVAVFGDG